MSLFPELRADHLITANHKPLFLLLLAFPLFSLPYLIATKRLLTTTTQILIITFAAIILVATSPTTPYQLQLLALLQYADLSLLLFFLLQLGRLESSLNCRHITDRDLVAWGLTLTAALLFLATGPLAGFGLYDLLVRLSPNFQSFDSSKFFLVVAVFPAAASGSLLFKYYRGKM